MAKLERIEVGCRVKGIMPNEAVSIIAVTWFGADSLEITYKNDKGILNNQLLYRSDEPELEIEDNKLPWSFDADGEKMRLASEAYRIKLAHLFDPYLAIHTSAVEPLPHQISAVYQEMLPQHPLRYILADDPGAGKTIMTGLLIKELIIRGDLKRCLIVTPGSLSEQWQDELNHKFNIHFEILTNDRIEAAASGNIFTEMNLCIARLDKLSRDKALQAKLNVTDWDLIVCDEAHKMSATVWGNDVKQTERYKLGKLLSNITRNFLLLTATPHNGKNDDFRLFLSLVDPDRFEGASHSNKSAPDVSGLMRRLVKEDLLKFDGTPLFPERIAYTVNYELSPLEAELYDKVTEYVRQEFNRADNLTKERKNTVGFALTVLQRRLASSPEAIYQSLHRRKERLEERLANEKSGKKYVDDIFSIGEDFDEDDWSPEEAEQAEERLTDNVSAASTIAELEAEILTLSNLESLANQVRQSGDDRKWEELSKLLQDNRRMFDPSGKREKLIIFTEHKDTLRYLTDKIRSLFGSDDSVVNISGGMKRDDRRKAEELFKQDVNTRIMIATDAAGEGINLQRAHLMINYDLPWNPNRLEQRFGRIHRIGQTEVCHLWNLVAAQTREGMVFERLFQKIEEERNALGGKVFDVLGKMTFDNKPLKDLLIDAVRYGNDPKVKERMWRVVDNTLDRAALQKLLDERALAEDTMDIHQVMSIREEMERIEARKLQPHFIEAFFVAAFKSIGGSIFPREKGRYEIKRVPYEIRNHEAQVGFGEPILQSYERVCFDKQFCNSQGLVPASLVCPGHPLLDAVVDIVLSRNADVLKRGTIFVNDTDYSSEARLLFYIEDSIQDGAVTVNGNKRIISQSMHFVELKEDGSAVSAGYAPYLDYRSATEDETAKVLEYVSDNTWLKNGVEDRAKSYAISNIIPQHFAYVKERRQKQVDKTIKQVNECLIKEIQYWDGKSATLKEKELAGKTNAKLNSELAHRRAEGLAARRDKRLAELELEKKVSPAPPVILGGALVIPVGLLHKLMGGSVYESPFGGIDKKATEIAAMNAVMNIETKLGYTPRDVSAEKVGYDVESSVPDERRTSEGSLRFIEVKGRVKGSDTVTISKNEMLCGLNKPEMFILALVEVDGDKTHTTYLKEPFQSPPDFAVTSINFNIKNLIDGSKVIYQE